MEKLGCWLGAIFFSFIVVIGGAEWTGSFWRGALTTAALVVVGIIGLFFSVWLVEWTRRRREGGEYQRLVIYGIGRKQARKEVNPWPKRQLS